MQKYYLKDLLKNRVIKQMETETAVILYIPRTNQILKVLKPYFLFMLNQTGINLEEKVLLSEKIKMSPSIVKPTSIVYDDKNCFIGYTTTYCKEQNLNQYHQKLPLSERQNLYQYAKLHQNIENAIKGSPEIVIPDLCTCDNILVGKNNTIKLIDYDGFQVKNIQTAFISSSLGDQNQYVNSSKYYQNGLFTKELDKKSLIILYFLCTFNVNLNKIGTNHPFENRKINLDDIFYELNLFDYDFNHKVWKIFNDKEPNEYLGEDMFRIADKYEMTAQAHPFIKDVYLKKLIKK